MMASKLFSKVVSKASLASQPDLCDVKANSWGLQRICRSLHEQIIQQIPLW